ncbi:hypothetical protein CY34DRAFT_101536 [Suillus luteus UH-Slu-Lm8-n1]|uniref:Uncharacterized protein n=1 Tax=Suillus luteus UH-Slu-Lm8-n1 TaxID=930992 RepID=A0A0D0A2N7_9AGAM|nr:hypothetical protein CY34DRAFT_101536 [Suillus luteus UH-Slu-Lm8-n1]
MRAGRITDHNSFLVGDLFVTILRTTRTLSIAVIRSTGLFLNDVSRASINTTIMKASRTTAKISGQLLTVIPTRPSTNQQVPISFLWDGGYVKAQSPIPGTSESTERIVIVSVPGFLVEPINPEPTLIRLNHDIDSDDFSEINGGQTTWQVPHDALIAACDLLWAKALEAKLPLKSIACVNPSDAKSFPYQLSDGTFFIYSFSFR